MSCLFCLLRKKKKLVTLLMYKAERKTVLCPLVEGLEPSLQIVMGLNLTRFLAVLLGLFFEPHILQFSRCNKTLDCLETIYQKIVYYFFFSFIKKIHDKIQTDLTQLERTIKLRPTNFRYIQQASNPSQTYHLNRDIFITIVIWTKNFPLHPDGFQ